MSASLGPNTNRYRLKDWTKVKRVLPEHIRQDCGDVTAPPGFVLVSFASQTAKTYVEAVLGPSLEPDRGLNILPYKRLKRDQEI